MSALLTRLLLFFRPLIQKYLLSKISAWIGVVIVKIKAYRWKKELDKKTEVLKEAGETPSLSPQEKAKEIEDAFDDVIDSANRP